jgi:hypothetical protein
MGRGRRVWLLVLALTGCHTSTPVSPRSTVPTAPSVALTLPETQPIPPQFDAEGLPRYPTHKGTGPNGRFRLLTEADCIKLAAAQSSAANSLDAESGIPPTPSNCDAPTETLRRLLRYHTALELRNQAVAQALDRFFQLGDTEARTDLLRQAFPVLDTLLAKARAAVEAGVRFPLATADLEYQRSQLESQLVQAEFGSSLLNIDLKRRLGLPAVPAEERLWPGGDFRVDPEPIDAEQAVTAALADRPELRGLRALYHGLTPETLAELRETLPNAGSIATSSRLARLLARKRGPDAATQAELEVRRKQLYELIADRERAVADEARAAALAVNTQRLQAALARDRVKYWDDKLADAVKKLEGKQPGADLLEAQVRLEWLKAKAELIAAVAAWHRARVQLRAAQGWLAWEALGPH